MRKQLDFPVFLARKIDRVATAKKLSFNEACLFLFSEVLAPRKNFARKGASTFRRRICHKNRSEA